jgi:hypothetical protein
MHPLSVAELGTTSAADWRALRMLGGFPEPFLGGSVREARRWSTEHRNLLKAKFPGTKDYKTPEGIRVAPAPALLKTLI